MYVNIQVFADRARKYFYFGLFNFIVTVLISTVLVYAYPGTLIGPMWGRLLSGVLIFALSLGYGLREFGIRLQFDLAKEIRTYSTPIVIFSLLTWVLSYINNYILNALATPADVGVYDFALKCTLVIEYAGLGLLGTINPRIFQLWKKNGNMESTQEENRYYHALSAVNILLIAANVFILPFIIRTFVHNEEYYSSIQFIPVLCASFVFKGLYGMYVNPVFYFKKTKVLPVVLGVTALVQIISGIILVRYFGIWGAVWSFFLVRPVLWLAARKIYRFRFNQFKLVIIPVLYAGAVVVLSNWSGMSEFTYLSTQLVIALALIFIAYKNELSQLKGIFRPNKD
jgi:O-antigen/teichoic acid export membrane protein